MGKILFIVESKGKLDTLRKILGSGYQVEACFGHIRDLKKKGLSIDTETFKGEYEITKPDVVKSLQAAAAKADSVLLGSDQDMEGFAIAEALAIVLKVDPKTNCRVLFSEITPVAIKAAIKNPVPLDMNMVHAQYVRRYLDRIVGYGLSSIVMGKVPGAMSAGRVQSAALRWVCDKQRARDTFIENGSDSYYKVRGQFKIKKQELKTVMYELIGKNEKNNDDNEIEDFDEDEDEMVEDNDKAKGKRRIAQLCKNVNPKETKEIEKFMSNCKKSTWQVDDVRDSESTRHPPPPFMTSSVQIAASGALGMSSKRTMSTLQVLFEKGYVTYPRTDSIVLSKTALAGIADYVKGNFDKKYYQCREYKDKKESSQNAHECLRSTKYDVPEITDLGRDEQRLYNLVWRRTIASQMASAKFDVKTIDISSANNKVDNKYIFVSKVDTMRFDGYLAVYNYKPPSEDGEESTESKKPIDVKKGTTADREIIESKLEFSAPPTLPSEAALVSGLKKIGVGRPSTFSSIIDKILSRGYAEITDVEGIKMKSRIYTLEDDEIKEESKAVMVGVQKKVICPTSMGMRVTTFLEEYFPKIVDYKFTANTEVQMDEVAQGKKDWKKILRKFYDWFEPAVNEIKAKIKAEKLERGDAPQFERIVGKMEDGREIYARNTKNGPALFVVQPDGKLKYADLGKLKLEKVTEEQARKLFSFPKVLGERKGIEVILKKGPYGFYLSYDKLTAPVPKEQDPFELSLEDAVVLLKAAKEARSDRYIKELEDDDYTYSVMKGKPGKDDKISYFVMVKPKPKSKEESDEDKKSKKKKKLTAEEKEAEKKVKDKKKMDAARGKKSKGDVVFVGIGSLDPTSITIAIVKELMKEKAEKPKYVKGAKGSLNAGQAGAQAGGKYSKNSKRKSQTTSTRKSQTGKNKQATKSKRSSTTKKKGTAKKAGTKKKVRSTTRRHNY